MEEAAVGPEGFDDAAVVAVVGDVAARAAGHEDLDAGLAALFEEQDAPAPLRREEGGKQSGGPAADDDGVPVVDLEFPELRLDII